MTVSMFFFGIGSNHVFHSNLQLTFFAYFYSISSFKNAFLLALETIPMLLSKLPKEFENIIRLHFFHKSKQILQHCQHYINKLNTSDNNINNTKNSDKIFFWNASEALVKSLQERLPKIVSALKENEEK